MRVALSALIVLLILLSIVFVPTPTLHVSRGRAFHSHVNSKNQSKALKTKAIYSPSTLKTYTIVEDDGTLEYVSIPDYSQIRKPKYILDWNAIRNADTDDNKIHDTLDRIIGRKGQSRIKVIVVLRNDDDYVRKEFINLGGIITTKYSHAIKGFAGEIPANRIPILTSRCSSIAIIEPNFNFTATMYFAPRTTGARPRAWNYITGMIGYESTSDFSIAIIDTGVDPNHPMLKGYSDAATNPNVWNNPNIKIVGWCDPVNGTSYPFDDNGHGTHCASIAAGNFYNMSVDDQNRSVIYSSFGLVIFGLLGTYTWEPPVYFRVLDNSEPIYIEVDSYDISIQENDTSHYSDLDCIEIYGPNDVLLLRVDDNSAIDQDPDDGSIAVNFTSPHTGMHYVKIVFSMYPSTWSYSSGPGAKFRCFIHVKYPEQADGYEKISGVSPRTKIVGVKVLAGSGSGSLDDILDGLDWVLGYRLVYRITIASMSFGTQAGQVVASINSAILQLVQNGVVVVVAAGNSGPDENSISGSPGLSDAAITVAASTVGIDNDPAITYYSSRGPGSGSTMGNTTKPDIAAPGGMPQEGTILAADSTGNGDMSIIMYATYNLFTGELILLGMAFDTSLPDTYSGDLVAFQGTSMATPHAAGAIALLVATLTNGSFTNWDYSVDDVAFIKAIVSATAWEFYTINRGKKDINEGWGMIQIDAAIEAIREEISPNNTYIGYLGGKYYEKHVWARKIYMRKGYSYNFKLTVPIAGDFDLYLYANDPKPDSSSPYGTWGEPLLLASSTNDREGIDEYITYTPSSSGWYLLTVKQISGNGTFTLDVIETINPPSCTIVEPTDGSEVSGNITVKVLATDTPPGTVVNVSLYIDGTEMFYLEYNESSGYWEKVLDTHLLEEGQHLLQAKATDDSGNDGWSEIVEVYVNNYPARILLVDDDGGLNYEVYYEEALEALGIDYDYYYVYPSNASGPSLELMQNYSVVIWFTGDTYANDTLTETDISNIEAYLDSGGRMFLCGQDIGYDLTDDGKNSSLFLEQYFGAEYLGDDADVDWVDGNSGTIFDGASYYLVGGDGGNNNQYPDYYTTSTSALGSAVGCLHYRGYSWAYGAIQHNTTTFKTVLFGFPFEAINNLDDRADAMKRILTFLDFDMPPEVDIYDPEYGAMFNYSDITIRWDAYDDNGITHFEIYVDNNPVDLNVPYYARSYTIHVDSDGKHLVRVVAVDTIDNRGYDTIMILVDLSPPRLVILSPENGTEYASSPVNITVTWKGSDDSGLKGYYVKLDDDDWIDVEFNTSYTFTSVEEGVHELFVKAENLAGLATVKKVIVFVAVEDTEPPTVHILSPKNGTYLNTTSVEVTWNGSDNIAIDKYYVKVDNGDWVDMGTATHYTIESLSEGDHEIYVKAVDFNDNEDISYVKITIDLTPPHIVWVNPENNSYINKSSFIIEWEFSDNNNISKYKISVDNDSWVDLGNTASYMVSDFPDGMHEFLIKALDVANNSAIARIVIIIDTQAPSLEIISPEVSPFYTNSTHITIEWTCNDSTALNGSYVRIDNGSWIYLADQTTLELNLTEGEHNIIIRVMDRAENRVMEEVVIVVDMVPPEIQVISPEVSPFYVNTTNITIIFNYSDNIGVYLVLVSIDNESWENITTLTSLNLNLSEGAHEVLLKVVDLAQNVESKSVKIIVDLTSPIVGIETLKNGSYYNVSSLKVAWYCIEENPADITIFIDDRAIEESFNTNDSLMYNFSEGRHTIIIVVTDKAGNEGRIMVSFFVDLTSPKIQLISPENNTQTTEDKVTVKWNVSDNFEIDKVLISLDGEEWVEVTDKSSYTFTDLSEGQHTIRIMAIDKAGNNACIRIVITVQKARARNKVIMLAAAIIATAIIAALAVILYKKKKAPPSEELIEIESEPISP